MKLEWDLMNNIKHVFVTLAQNAKIEWNCENEKNEHLVVNVHVTNSHDQFERPGVSIHNYSKWSLMN